MATTTLPPESPETQQQYAAQILLSAALIQALRQLWGATLPLGSDAGRVRFREGVHALVEQFSGAASSIATDYYRARRRDAGITTTLPPRVLQPVPAPPRSLVDAGLDWAMREAQKHETRLADELAALEEQMQTRLEAAMQKALTDVSRDQVVAAVQNDDMAIGFRRVPRPGACAFCIIQAIRSTTRTGLAKDFKRYAPGTMGGEKHYGVYKSRGTAGEDGDFLFDGPGTAKFHNNCHCVVEPVFSPAEALPDWLADMERLYDDTEGGLNDFRRTIAAIRRGEEPQPPPSPAIVAPNPQVDQINALLDLLSQAA